MNEFDYCSQFVVLRCDVAEAAGRQQHQCRTQSLAPAVDDIFGDLVDQQHFGMQAFANDCIHCAHVGRDAGLYGFERHVISY